MSIFCATMKIYACTINRTRLKNLSEQEARQGKVRKKKQSIKNIGFDSLSSKHEKDLYSREVNVYTESTYESPSLIASPTG
mmetsp:Transcript_21992/g.29286  ORF Transcript_21992/g.29286 Transcript_21992/m.29286 type:complete len:81 (-) Transcript_21992:2635-2877(-)